MNILYSNTDIRNVKETKLKTEPNIMTVKINQKPKPNQIKPCRKEMVMDWTARHNAVLFGVVRFFILTVLETTKETHSVFVNKI